MNNHPTAESILSLEEFADGDAEPVEPRWSVSVAKEQTTLDCQESRLIQAVEVVLERTAYRAASVSIAVVDDPTMQALNCKYLGHDYPTDVLSFPLDDSPACLEGELIVSADTAVRGAAEVGWSAEDELLLYVVHGALHLVGYRDDQAETQHAMFAAELEALQRLGVSLPGDKSRWAQAMPQHATRNKVSPAGDWLS